MKEEATAFLGAPHLYTILTFQTAKKLDCASMASTLAKLHAGKCPLMVGTAGSVLVLEISSALQNVRACIFVVVHDILLIDCILSYSSNVSKYKRFASSCNKATFAFSAFNAEDATSFEDSKRETKCIT